jgi:hypothetical protein
MLENNIINITRTSDYILASLTRSRHVAGMFKIRSGRKHVRIQIDDDSLYFGCTAESEWSAQESRTPLDVGQTRVCSRNVSQFLKQMGGD